MYWSRSLKPLLILSISYDSFAAEKISTDLNEIQDLNRNTAGRYTQIVVPKARVELIFFCSDHNQITIMNGT